MKILITGAAGMIGFHSAMQFKKSGHHVFGVDNFNDYYEVELKEDRAKILKEEYDVDVYNIDIRDMNWEESTLGFDVVLHLAAYANPRHALAEPQPYIDTNITGTQRLIEGCEKTKVPVVYASSSCVMHGQPLPWNEHDKGAHQNNPYGWSKYVNECQFAHSKIKSSVGLRFFTVYGPYGRPDMALFKFTRGILNETPIDVFNYGDMKRDFTFVDDIVQGVEIVVNALLEGKIEKTHDIFNIGYGQQVQLMDFIKRIEECTGKKAIMNMLPPHPADTPETWSDTTKLQRLGYKPTTSIHEGVEKFIKWYSEYYVTKEVSKIAA